jgi:cytochrome c
MKTNKKHHIMRLFIVFIGMLLLNSCNTDKKTEKEIESGPPARTELSQDSKIFLGNRLFSEKTCITCHAIDRVNKAPSVVEIMHVYKTNNADIVTFLKGHAKPIVDTTASQVAIMQANIDGFLKQITDEELNAISTYMMHVDELSKNNTFK